MFLGSSSLRSLRPLPREAAEGWSGVGGEARCPGCRTAEPTGPSHVARLLRLPGICADEIIRWRTNLLISAPHMSPAVPEAEVLTRSSFPVRFFFLLRLFPDLTNTCDVLSKDTSVLRAGTFSRPSRRGHVSAFVLKQVPFLRFALMSFCLLGVSAGAVTNPSNLSRSERGPNPSDRLTCDDGWLKRIISQIQPQKLSLLSTLSFNMSKFLT